MALSAVNILHLNGPLEAKQTQTGLHTNDRRGPGVSQGTRHVSMCVPGCVGEIQCVHRGNVVCWKQTRRLEVLVCWTGKLIVCDMGQEGTGG